MINIRENIVVFLRFFRSSLTSADVKNIHYVSYRSHKDDLVPDGVLYVSKEIECTGSNHVQEQAAL